MSEELYPYYQAELYFIRKLAQEFARKYPAAAARLQLEPDRSADPHVERLIEAFALLAGRVQLKIDDEFPELTDALLSSLYPHYLAPVPSFAPGGLPPGRTRPALVRRRNRCRANGAAAAGTGPAPRLLVGVHRRHRNAAR